MAQLSPLPLENSLLAKTLNARNPFQFVIEVAQNYNTPLFSIVSAFNNWKSEQINTEKYERAKVGNLAVSATIATSTASGANLVLTFVDAAYSDFRVGDEVMDGNQYKGYVIFTAPGTVTIQPGASGPLVAGTNFSAGMTIKYLSNASATRASQGVSSLYLTPELDHNFYEVKRDSVFLAGSDFVDTYVQFHGKQWAHAQEWTMMQRLIKSCSEKYIWSERAQYVTPQGKVNSNGGLVWSIKNRGGSYIPSTTAITKSVFEDVIYQIRLKNGKSTQELTFFCGSAALMQIQNFIGDIAKFAGVNSTFGGKEIKGYSFPMYSIADVMCKLVYEPALDNPEKWAKSPSDFTTVPGLRGSKMSNSFLVVDTTPANIYGGGTEPIIKQFHFGKEMSYGYIKGMIDAGDGSISEGNYMPSSSVISSDVDGLSAHAIIRNGINVVDASGMGFYEMVV